MYVMEISRFQGLDICRSVHSLSMDENSKTQGDFFPKNEAYVWQSKPPSEKAGVCFHIEIEHPRLAAGGFDYRRSLVFERKGPYTTYCVRPLQFDLRGKQGLYETIPYMKTTRSSDLFQKAPH